jgi:type I restriction enzyme, S subunit
MSTEIIERLETDNLDLPVNWKKVRLKYLAMFENSGDYGAEQGESTFDLPVCTTAHITRDGKLLIKDMPIRSFDENEKNRYTGKEGDIFVVKSSGSNTNIISGKLALIDSQIPDVVFSNFLMRITPNKEICSPRFLAYFLDSGITKERIHKMVATTTYPNINVEEYSSELVPVPPLETQTKIANYLDCKTAELDQLIGAKQRLLKLLDEKKRTLIARAVTRGLSPDAPLKDSGIPWLGMIPAHWEIDRARWLFAQSDLPVRKDDEMVTCFRDGMVTLRRNRREVGFTNAILELGYQGIRKGQLVLHSMDAFAGAIGVSDSDGKCTPEYVICEPITDKTNSDYYGLLLREMALQNFVQAHCSAVRERAPRIRFNQFKDFELPVPPIDEQITIVMHIKQAMQSLEQLQEVTKKTITLLQERRTALISAAVTGKLSEEVLNTDTGTQTDESVATKSGEHSLCLN